MKKILVIISIIATLFILIYVLVFNKKIEPLYPINKNVVNSFFELSDSTSSELIPKYELLNEIFINTMINYNQPIKSILKKVHIDSANYKIELVAICPNNDAYKAFVFSLDKSSILIDSLYLNAPVVDYFTFNEFCNYRYLKIKSKNSKILNDYCFLTIDKNNYSFLNLKEDSLGEDVNKIRDNCNAYWIDNHEKYFNNIFEKSSKKD